MAIYHLNVRGVALGRGSSAVKSSAYQSGQTLTRALTGERCSYRRAERVSYAAVILPDGAPEALADRGALWNAAEAAADAMPGLRLVARRTEFALPVELPPEAAEACAREYAERVVAETGHAVDLAIHGAGGPNPHAHMLETAMAPSGTWDPADPAAAFAAPAGRKNVKRYLCRDREGNERWLAPEEWRPVKKEWAKLYTYTDGRRLTKDEARDAGLNPTKDRRNTSPVSRVDTADGDNALDAARADLVHRRELWEQVANAHLARQAEAEGAEPQSIDHRSNAARGLLTSPTAHEGAAVRQAEAAAMARARRDGAEYEPVTDRAGRNAEVRRDNNAFMAALTAAEEARDLAREDDEPVTAQGRGLKSLADAALALASQASERSETAEQPMPADPPVLSTANARADLAAVRDFLAGDPMGTSPRERAAVDRAVRAVTGPSSAGGQTAEEATSQANDALRDAWGAARTAREAFGRAMELLRGYVARIIVAMEALRYRAESHGGAFDPRAAAPHAVVAEMDDRARRGHGGPAAGPQTGAERQLELTYQQAMRSARRARQRGRQL